MIFGVEGAEAVRRERLIELLDIDLQWRMHKASDAQRRSVQICMGLLHPFKVLLLDEVTVDVDVVASLDSLDFFKEECDQRGATIVCATHIFDELETWATHLAYIQDGELRKAQKLSEISGLRNSANLLSVPTFYLLSSPGFVLKLSWRRKNPSTLPLPKSERPHLLSHLDTWRTTDNLQNNLMQITTQFQCIFLFSVLCSSFLFFVVFLLKMWK